MDQGPQWEGTGIRRLRGGCGTPLTPELLNLGANLSMGRSVVASVRASGRLRGTEVASELLNDKGRLRFHRS